MRRLVESIIARMPGPGWPQRTPVGFWNGLAIIDGTFEASREEKVDHLLGAGCCVATWGFMNGVLISGFSDGRAAEVLITESIVALLVLAIGAYAFLRRRCRYRIVDATLSKVDDQGRIVWCERIDNCRKIELRQTKFTSHIVFRWPGKRRTIPAWDALLERLQDTQSERMSE